MSRWTVCRSTINTKTLMYLLYHEITPSFTSVWSMWNLTGLTPKTAGCRTNLLSVVLQGSLEQSCRGSTLAAGHVLKCTFTSFIRQFQRSFSLKVAVGKQHAGMIPREALSYKIMFCMYYNYVSSQRLQGCFLTCKNHNKPCRLWH